MRPMPGMVGLIPSNSKVLIFPFSVIASMPIINLRGFLLFVHQDKKKIAPAKGSEVKRTRRDRRELENIIFKLFEKQPNWALKQLVIETDQPEVWSFFQFFCSQNTLNLHFYPFLENVFSGSFSLSVVVLGCLTIL